MLIKNYKKSKNYISYAIKKRGKTSDNFNYFDFPISRRLLKDSNIKWIATDGDGSIYGYTRKPYTTYDDTWILKSSCNDNELLLLCGGFAGMCITDFNQTLKEVV